MTVFNKSFLGHVPAESGSLEIRLNLKQSNQGPAPNLDLSKLYETAPQDNFTIVEFLQDYQFETEEE
jgi:hypothetical protein